MSFATWSDFIDMGGYGLYVWGSLGMCAAVVVAELAALSLRRRTLLRDAAHQPAPDAGESTA